MVIYHEMLCLQALSLILYFGKGADHRFCQPWCHICGCNSIKNCCLVRKPSFFRDDHLAKTKYCSNEAINNHSVCRLPKLYKDESYPLFLPLLYLLMHHKLPCYPSPKSCFANNLLLLLTLLLYHLTTPP